VGTVGDGKVDFLYNNSTGDITLLIDGATLTTTGGQPSFISSITIQSASGLLKPQGASAGFKGGTGLTTTANLLASALTNAPGFTEGFDLGMILDPNVNPNLLLSDLTVKYQVLNGGSLKAADVFVPEPSSLAFLGVGAAGLLARRRMRLAKRSSLIESPSD
jgi:hypothetical protein